MASLGDAGRRGFLERLAVASWLTGLMLGLLILRLYQLQVVRGQEMRDKGRRNFVNQVQISHDRGVLLDRRGRVLVDNRPSLNLEVTPAFLGRAELARDTLIQLTRLVGLQEEEIVRTEQSMATRTGLERFRPILVRRDLTPAQVEAIEAERSLFRLDGVSISEGRRRTYRYGPLAAHVLGYVGEIDGGALDVERARGNPEHYDLGDFIGRDGLERTLEHELRGQDGREQVVVDAKGRRQPQAVIQAVLGEHRLIPPRPGHHVFLTLDLELQQVAERALRHYGRAGSVVALDVATGAVLVLASWPAYDANVISGSFSQRAKEELDTDPLKPWINRSIAGQYAPGSTFKVVTALAGLEQQVTLPNEQVFCPGHYRMGRHTWRCWRDAGHGAVDLRKAMKSSCDTFFYTLGSRLGINPIAHMARRLSFGQRTGIGLRGEGAGTVPDEAFHNRVEAATGGYQRGMAINTSIGQGALAVTPLQMALAYAAIAHGKKTFVPQLVDHISTADLRMTRRFLDADDSAIVEHVEGDGPHMVTPFSSKVLQELEVSDASLSQVRQGLAAVTQEVGGSAFASRSLLTTMAGKTGTAQVIRLGRERLKGWQTDYFERDHAWFVAYAPIESPQIVLAVLNEHGGHGGSAAAPIAVAVIDAFIRQNEREAAARRLDSP